MEALVCLVVAIVDGDTLKVRCGEAAQQTVRIAQIDAPEKGQPWAEQSRQALAGLCFKVAAEVQVAGSDRYGRTVAAVSCGGVDAGKAQVQAGMAWAFTRYKPGRMLIQAENAAPEAGSGLWSAPDPVTPWEWRASRAARGGH